MKTTSYFSRFICVAALLVVTGAFTGSALAEKVGVNCLADGGVNCNQPIPDGSGNLTSTITFPAGSCASVARVCIATGVEHTWRGDLSVNLTHGATTVPLVTPNASDDNDDIYQGFVLETQFDGQIGDGAWNLTVSDNTNGQYGSLNNWTLGLCCGTNCGSGLVLVNPVTGLLTTEAGGTGVANVELTCPPFNEVTIPTVTSSDGTEGSVAPTSLVFNAGNQAAAQALTMTGQDDSLIDGDIPYTITLGAPTIGAPFAGGLQPPDLYNPPSVYAGLILPTLNVVNRDNDAVGPQSNLNITDVSMNEAVGTATFSVILAQATNPFTINFATANNSALTGGDYTAAAGTLTFAGTANEVQTITVPIIDDGILESTESFFVNLSAISNPSVTFDAQGIGTIIDNDSAALSISSVTVSEIAGTATFNVTLGNAVPGGFTINFASADNTATASSDYAAATGALTFAGTANEVQTITVPIIDDAVIEPTEIFFVNLSAISNIAVTFQPQSFGSIIDNDTANGSRSVAVPTLSFPASLILSLFLLGMGCRYWNRQSHGR